MIDDHVKCGERTSESMVTKRQRHSWEILEVYDLLPFLPNLSWLFSFRRGKENALNFQFSSCYRNLVC